MKKWIFAASVALIVMFAMVGCKTGNEPGPGPGGDTPTVNSVTVSPKTANVAPGGNRTFTATVAVSHGAAQTVSWSVSGNKASTTITAAGVLTVGSDETFDTVLTVRATSTADGTKSDTATVTVVDPDTIVKFTINFDTNYPTGFTYTGPAIAAKEIEEGFTVDDAGANWLPAGPAAPEGYVFDAWYTTATGGNKITGDSTFTGNTTVYARWIQDVLTGDDAWEALYLENGAIAVYKFTIPSGNTLGDYKEITAQYKVSAAGLAAWDDGKVANVRLLGVYTPAIITANQKDSDAPNPEFNQSVIKYIPRTTHSTPYIIDNGNTSSSVKPSVTANEWFKVTYDLSGARKHDDAVAANFGTAQAGLTGDVYFALGISNQDSNKGKDRGEVFFQLIKDVTLVPADDADEVTADIPEAAEPQFVCYNDPIVFAWRGDLEDAKVENMPYIAIVEAPTVDRGETPADADLEEVLLGSPGYTYIHTGGNRNNQKGWVSFGEAGRAEAQDWKTTDGGITNIALSNFKNAWYLVLETTSLPTGRFDSVWLGDARGWVQKNGVVTTAGAVADISTIDEKEGGGYIIKLFLPKALDDYYYYFDEENGNKEWAGLGFSYWGENNANIDNLGITKAYLLVHKDEVEGPATGVSLGLTFELSAAPEGGAVIGDVVLNASGDLIVSAAAGLTDYRWYLDGAPVTPSPGINLKITSAEDTYIISLQAKRGGKWVSQTVVVTVAE